MPTAKEYRDEADRLNIGLDDDAPQSEVKSAVESRAETFETPEVVVEDGVAVVKSSKNIRLDQEHALSLAKQLSRAAQAIR